MKNIRWKIKVNQLRVLAVALVMLLAGWVVFLISITQEASIYDTMGPNDDPFWNVAQFRTAADDFQASIFRFVTGDRKTPEAVFKIKFEYEILVSKFFIISQRSDSTKFAYRQPEYAPTIARLSRTIQQMDVVMADFPSGGPATIERLQQGLTIITSSYDEFIKAIGAAEVKRRDFVLRSALRDRAILLYSNIGVAVIFLFAIVMLARSARNFQKSFEAARQVAFTKQIFLGALNHELRNPLQTIVSAVDNVSDSPMDRRVMSAVLAIDRAARHIETHLRDLTDFLRLETVKTNLNIDWVDVHRIVSQCESKFSAMAAKKGLRLTSTPLSSEVSLLSDEQRIQQILDNIVENAIKYSERGVIEIRFGSDAADRELPIFIEVIDEGVGIHEQKMKYLFSPFFQSQFPENRYDSGYGMGLAVVRGLVQVLGGAIQVDSEVEKGTSFRMSFPLDFRYKPGDGAPGRATSS